ncbi:MAG TPA: two-component regulator propeller domain-containing protein, partial [Candidatus Binatia bacterium]|nr:two-component regulator propeller domain-containing protein [Candidatus Binatia bacterium]
MAALALLFACAGPALAGNGDWFVRAWHSDEGLPDNNVTGIAQAPDGYLWVATLSGLVRFDGARFQEFSPDNLADIPGRGVRAMILDHRHRLWLALDRGIVVCLESNKARVYTKRDGVPTVTPQLMTEDGDGGIWIFNTRRNLVRIKDGTVSSFGVEEGLPSGTISCSLTSDLQGRLWFAVDNKVGIFQNGQFQVLLTLPERQVAIAKSADGGIWICAGSRVLKYDQAGQLKEQGLLPADVEPNVA